MTNSERRMREVPTWEKIKIIWNQPKIPVPFLGGISPKLLCGLFLLSYAGIMTCSIASIAQAASLSLLLLAGNMASFALCVASTLKLRYNPLVREQIFARERELNRAPAITYSKPTPQNPRNSMTVPVVTSNIRIGATGARHCTGLPGQILVTPERVK